MEKKIAEMSFWAGETCEYCDGEIMEKRVTLYRRVQGQHVLLKDVPAGVCSECGTRYYAANVLKTIEESVKGRQKTKRSSCLCIPFGLAQ